MFGFEVFAKSRGDLKANPDIDPIQALVFTLSNEKVKYSDMYKVKRGNNRKKEFDLNGILIVVGTIFIVDEEEYKDLKLIKDKIKVFYSKEEFFQKNSHTF